MHAMIMQGGGRYYISPVFGHYSDIVASKRVGGFKSYWIVWDAERSRLIRQVKYLGASLVPTMLIVDSAHDDWVLNEDGEGCVGFLSKELLDSFLDLEVQPEEILAQCRAMDAGYVYQDIQEIRSEQDIENLMWASGCFHDGRIDQETLQADGTLYIRFTGTWGCDIELWFRGDLQYDTSSKDPEFWDPYWSDATMILQDGFVYLADEENLTVEEIEAGHYCAFKARQVRYRVIPA